MSNWKTTTTISCGCIPLIASLFFGGYSLHYLLIVYSEITHRPVQHHWIIETIVGTILSSITVPAAIITWALRLFGVI